MFANNYFQGQDYAELGSAAMQRLNGDATDVLVNPSTTIPGMLQANKICAASPDVIKF